MLLLSLPMTLLAQTTDHKETLNIHVTTPGTLGDLVLAQTENFSDVKYFTLSGSLIGDDFYSLSNRMTSIVTLDIGNLDNETMPEKSFYEHDALTSIVLPKKMLVISKDMFFRCDNLSNITFPPNLRKIDRSAFNDCIALTSLVLPETVDTLEDYSLQGCKNVTSIKLPARMKHWGDEVFYGWEKLTSITIPEGITEIRHYTFYSCNALTSIVVPSWVTVIGDHAFHYCRNLKNVSLPEGLIDIEGEAFSWCSALTEIDLPSTLRRVTTAFYCCKNLKTIRCHAINPPSASTYYRDGLSLSDSATIYVPAISLTTYKQTKAWDSHPILPLEGMPAGLSFFSDMTLNLPATLPADYKPNMLLGMNYDTNGAYDNNGWNKRYYYYPAVTVNGNTTLSLSNFHAEGDASLSEGYNSNDYYYIPKLYSCLINNAPIRADKVSISRKVNYYANYGGYWQFFALPFNARVSEIELSLSSDFVIYEYSGAKRAASEFNDTWVRVPNDGILLAGKGYIMKCSNTHEVATFYAIDDNHKNDIFRHTEANVQLEEYLSEYAHNRSWNFIGCPYYCYYDTRLLQYDAPFVVWNKFDRQYETYTPYDDNYILEPGEGFFLQRPIDKASVLFPLEGRQGDKNVVERSTTPAPSRRAAVDRTVFNLTLNGDEGMTDRTRFVLSPQATAGYDDGCDATKFISLDPQVPQLYTIENGERYSINERPIGDGIIHLGLTLAAKGTYTLTMNAPKGGNWQQEPITLTDHLTGQRTVLTTDSYTFTAESGTHNDRFTLEVGNMTGISEKVTVNSEEFATASVYNLNGQRVMNATKGIYIIGGKKHVVK